MGLRWGDNVVESSTTTTTGAYQLAGVPASGEKPGTQTFVAGIGDTNTCYYRAEEAGGTAWETGLGTVADAATDTLTRTRIDGSSNGGAAVDWTGKTVRIYCTLPAYAIRRAVADHPFLLDNATIVCTRSGGAETFHLKTADGSDPSPANPARAAFLNASGGFDVLERTSALSVTMSSNSTGGAIANLAFKAGVLLLNNAGVLDMGVVVRPSGIRDNSIVSTTAEGGAGGADSPRVIYSATALTNVRCRVHGYVTYTLATEGTWNTAPSEILLTRAGASEIQVRELLYEKTLTADGSFDTNEWWPSGTLPNSYDAYEIHTQLRSNTASGRENCYIYFNGDTTVTNYHSQRAGAENGGNFISESAAPMLIFADSAASPTSAFTDGIVVIQNPSSTDKLKIAVGFSQGSIGVDSLVNTMTAVVWDGASGANAINRIQVVTDNDPTDQFVSGSTQRIYGLKTMTVLS